MGPVITLLLAAELSAELLAWLRTCSRGLTVTDGVIELWIDDPAAIGAAGLDTSTACLISLSEPRPGHPDWPLDDPEEAAAYRRLPGPSRSTLVLDTGCNEPLDHRLLGQLALTLARRFDALLDFGGSLDHRGEPRSPAQHEAERDWERQPLSALPGRQWDLGWHVGDADFLAAWLAHPRYALIK